MFLSKAFAVVLVAAVCRAVPVWVGEYPAWRASQPPSVAFGFGSGFSSDIGGIRHSSGVGASFQSGNGRAFGSGFGSAGGNTYAQGVGTAQVEPTYYASQPQPIYNNYGSPLPSSQNYGAGSSPAQSHSNVQYPVVRVLPYYNTAFSSAQTSRGQGYNTAVSTVQGPRGLGYNAALSAVQDSRGLGYNTAISTAQSHKGASDYGSAVSFAQTYGGVRASAAEALQRHGGRLQQASASSIYAPGLQVAHAHSVNGGGY